MTFLDQWRSVGTRVGHVTFLNQRSIGTPCWSCDVFGSMEVGWDPVLVTVMFLDQWRSVGLVFQGSFMVFHGFWLVSMVFQGSFIVSHGF